jgi:putative ABC transport system permease protein
MMNTILSDFIINQTSNINHSRPIAMLQNYFKIAVRALSQNKIFSFINLFGLAVGIAVFGFILQYISFEYSFNDFHKNGPQLYRILHQNQEGQVYPYTFGGIGPKAKSQLPPIQDFCRVADGIASGVVVANAGKNTEKSFRENKMAYVDANFLEVFSFKVSDGNTKALYQTNSMGISEETAQKYFGTNKAAGKTMTISNQFGTRLYNIAVVFENMPLNSDIKLDLVLSFKTLENPANLNDNSWANLNEFNGEFLQTYFLLKPNTDPNTVAKAVYAIKTKNKPDDNSTKILLQPFGNIHLPERINDPMKTAANGNLGFVYLMSSIAILILVIAWFNYVNLATATALRRAKEVGIRKVNGATRSQLIFQFLGESLLLNIVAVLFALLLIEILQKPFNQLIGYNLSWAIFGQSNIIWGGLAILIIGALASGAYNAFALSGYSPSQTLKGSFGRSSKGAWVRQTLVVFQFGISIVLIIATVIMHRQLNFMQSKDLGFNINQVLILKGAELGKDSTYKNRKEFFLNQINGLSYVKSSAASGAVPGHWYNFSTGGITKESPKTGDDKKNYNIALIDQNYIPTFEMTLAAGQNFKAQDCNKAFNDFRVCMLNESAAKSLGFANAQSATGQKIIWGERIFEVSGVIKDYHHEGLRSSIAPIIFMPQNSSAYIAIRLGTDQLQDKIKTIQALYQKSFAGNPFDYFFLDDQFNKQYQSDQRNNDIFTIASLLAILIACLGLFGLAAFVAESRTKEIGIRKVLGASIPSIVALLSLDFLKLIGIAAIIAVPSVWYLMTEWIKDFPYQTKLSWWIFGGSVCLTVAIALLTVSLQATKAALSNPIKSLKAE